MVQKECKKCGMLINKNDSSCLYCGGQEFCQPKSKKKKLKKRLIPFICCVLAITIFYGFASSLDDALNSEEEINETEVVNFDLSEYDSYGELSCGLIWVEKTNSSYDEAPVTKFAFADADGNIKSQWFDSEKFEKANFVNGIVVLKGYKNCLVYDTQFNELIDTKIKIERDYTWGNVQEIVIAEANERGEVFGIADLDDDCYELLMVNKEKVVTFSVPENGLIFGSVSNLERIEYDKGYYIIDFRVQPGNLPGYMGVFNEKGECIFEPSEELEYWVYSIKVISENRFEIMFEGMDGKYYNVEIDDTCQFLTEPELV